MIVHVNQHYTMHCAVVSMGQYNEMFDNFDPNKKAPHVVATQALRFYSELPPTDRGRASVVR